jgi:hypothetical protein
MEKYKTYKPAIFLARLLKNTVIVVLFKLLVSFTLSFMGVGGISYLESAGILSLIMVLLWAKNQLSLKNAHLYVR